MGSCKSSINSETQIKLVKINTPWHDKLADMHAQQTCCHVAMLAPMLVFASTGLGVSVTLWGMEQATVTDTSSYEIMLK